MTITLRCQSDIYSRIVKNTVTNWSQFFFFYKCHFPVFCFNFMYITNFEESRKIKTGLLDAELGVGTQTLMVLGDR